MMLLGEWWCCCYCCLGWCWWWRLRWSWVCFLLNGVIFWELCIVWSVVMIFLWSCWSDLFVCSWYYWWFFIWVCLLCCCGVSYCWWCWEWIWVCCDVSLKWMWIWLFFVVIDVRFWWDVGVVVGGLCWSCDCFIVCWGVCCWSCWIFLLVV